MGFLAEHEEVAGVRCLRFMTRARCIVGVGLSALLTLSAAGRAIAADTSLEKRLASATVLQEFNTEGAYIRQFQVAQNLVVFELWKSDSTIVVAYDLSGKQRFRIGEKVVPDSEFPRRLVLMGVSEDGRTLIVPQVTGLEWYTYRVFDISGSLRFELGGSAYLLPSPSGKYFCNLWDEISKEPPTIFDHEGKEVRRFEQLHYYCSRFLDDERLIVADLDTAYFIATRTGEVIKKVPVPVDLPGHQDYPRIRVSRSASAVAVYGDRAILLLSFDGEVLWRQEFKDYLSAVAFDGQAPWMALQLEIPGTSTGYIEVVSVLKPDRSVKSEPTSSLAGYWPRTFEVLWFSRGIITVWQPAPAVVDALDVDADYSTLFMELDMDSLLLSQPATRPSLYWVLTDRSQIATYLRAQPHGMATIVSVKPKDKEAEK